jgi:hypothetical protein
MFPCGLWTEKKKKKKKRSASSISKLLRSADIVERPLRIKSGTEMPRDIGSRKLAHGISRSELWWLSEPESGY